MGYQTDFEGEWNVTPPIKPEHIAYLKQFANTRRMQWGQGVEDLPDPIREHVGLPAGYEGAYYVNNNGVAGQDHSPLILDYNFPPHGQPGLWCKWEPSDDGTTIGWNGAEKFYDYVDWIKYLIDNFLESWGYVLNGDINWQGEDIGDLGTISIKDNVVRVYHAEMPKTQAEILKTHADEIFEGREDLFKAMSLLIRWWEEADKGNLDGVDLNLMAETEEFLGIDNE